MQRLGVPLQQIAIFHLVWPMRVAEETYQFVDVLRQRETLTRRIADPERWFDTGV